MAERTILQPREVERLISAALERCNTSPANAASVARALLGAELTGQGGHGLRRGRFLCRPGSLRQGRRPRDSRVDRKAALVQLWWMPRTASLIRRSMWRLNGCPTPPFDKASQLPA